MNNKKFIWILLRGGLDGISLLPPYGLDEYYSLRPNISIPKNKVLKINDKYGIYPSLKNGLYELFQNGNLLLYPQSGHRTFTDNHYTAQKQMERASFLESDNSGWLNRMVSFVNDANPISFSPDYPMVFRGKNIINNVGIERYNSKINQSNQHQIFEILKQTQLKNVFKKVLEQKKTMENLLVEYPEFNNKSYAEKIGIYLRETDSNLAFLDTGHNWDTHSLFNPGVVHGNESHNFDKHSIDVSTDGRLFFLFNMLDETIMSLKKELKDEWNNTLIAINTEFGRSNAENGSQGLDHGYGGLMMVTGGLIKESKIIGDIESLKPEDSYQGKYLHVKNDYRDVLSELFEKHLDLEHSIINKIFNR